MTIHANNSNFRQILPVVLNGQPADELKACLKKSHLWSKVKVFKLTKNMRAENSGDLRSVQFAKDLLAVGEGRYPTDENGTISLERLANNVKSTHELCQEVFPNLSVQYKNKEWLSERAILASKNTVVEALNERLLQHIPGETKTYRSTNKAVEEHDECEFPPELLDSLKPLGLPPHILSLKVGAPIMILRNLDPPRLCNGTRLIVKDLTDHLIDAEILSGKYKGERVLIPRIPMIPENYPFKFKRIQFPVKLCFAMSINKAQGQTLKVTGLHLIEPCFSHGQLYVALSRVGSPNHIYTYMGMQQRTKNFVIKAVLT